MASMTYFGRWVYAKLDERKAKSARRLSVAGLRAYLRQHLNADEWDPIWDVAPSESTIRRWAQRWYDNEVTNGQK